MAKGIDLPMKDEGEVNFNTDFGTGKIAVTFRAPLSIDRQTVQIKIADLLEIAARILLESIELQRQMLSQGIATPPKKESGRVS